MTIKGKKLDFDPFDMKTMEIYNEKAKEIERYNAEAFSLEKSGEGFDALIEVMKNVPRLLSELIEKLWGKDVRKELEPKIVNINDSFDILDEFNLLISGEYQKTQERRMEKFQKKYFKDVENE